MASITKEKPEIGEARRRIQWRIARESTAVNCWHLGESESAAMWNQYSKQGLALQTTFAALVTSLPRKAGDEVGSRPIFVGKVRYVDYESTTIPEDNAYWPFMHKRLSFAHEQEVRAVILCHGDQMQEYREADATFLEPGLHDEGVHVPVDLASLIGCIYVSPTSPAWFADVVRSVLARFGMNVQVEHSALDAPPIH